MSKQKMALLIGIDNYEHVAPLTGCVADALAMRDRLQRNADGSPNYECEVLTYGREPSGKRVTRAALRQACRKLFEHDGDVLLYFSGHGALTNTGGFLATCEAEKDDWGVPMQEIVQMANASRAGDIIFMLDCCHSGDAANTQPGGFNPLSSLREDMTVLAASRDSQAAMESKGHGIFTAAALDALDGGAADHMGWVTAPSIYSYVERRFGAWHQRPVYKTHATGLTVVRQCAPLVERLKLHAMLEHFPSEDYKYRLDPEFEPEDEHGKVHKPVNKEKVRIALLFKEYRDAGLLKASKPNEQLFWTARKRHTVELTLRGREYWRLVSSGRI